MDSVLEIVGVAPKFEERLKDIAKLKGDNVTYEQVALQGLYVVHLMHYAKMEILQEDTPLFLPHPSASGLPSIHYISVWITQRKHESMRWMCEQYRLDKQSMLSWGIDCLQILEETLMTHRLFWGPSREEVKFHWIHKQTST